MRKILILTTALTIISGYSTDAFAQSAALTASGGAFDSYNNATSTSLNLMETQQQNNQNSQTSNQISNTSYTSTQNQHQVTQETNTRIEDMGPITVVVNGERITIDPSNMQNVGQVFVLPDGSTLQLGNDAATGEARITLGPPGEASPTGIYSPNGETGTSGETITLTYGGQTITIGPEDRQNGGDVVITPRGGGYSGVGSDPVQNVTNLINSSYNNDGQLTQREIDIIDRQLQQLTPSERTQVMNELRDTNPEVLNTIQIINAGGSGTTGLGGGGGPGLFNDGQNSGGGAPFATQTNLLGNAALNNAAYTLNTWAVNPWNTPFGNEQNQAAAGLNQFDARSWISEMPNGEGYSTTLGFQAPYSGGHGPLVSDMYSNIEVSFDPLGRAGLPTPGAPRVATLFDGLSNPIAQSVANSINSPTQSLAFIQTAALVQAGILPLHFLITWGAGSSDLDLHLTGPLGASRFHIYFSARGSLTGEPHAALIDDCVSASCAEVIRVEEFNAGTTPNQVYRASVYNYGDGAGTNLSSQSGVEMMVVRGGTVQQVQGATDTGSIVTGGEILFRGSPTPGQAGDTWTAIEVNPDTGDVNFVNQISTSGSSGNVQ